MAVIHERYLRLAAGILLAAAVCVVYWPGLHGPMVFDDIFNVGFNQKLRLESLDMQSLTAAASSGHEGNTLRRPVAMLSFALNFYFTGSDIFYFKLTNLILHLASGVCLFSLSVILLSQLRDDAIGPSLSPQQIRWLALGIIAVWLLHPLNVTSVLYVVQRMAGLASMFIMLGLLSYCIGRRQLITGERKGFVPLLATVFIFLPLAAFSKETGVLLLVFVLFVELLFFRFRAHHQVHRSFQWIFGFAIGLPLAVGAMVAILNVGDVLGMWMYQYRHFTLGERLLTEARVMWFYLSLIIVPNIKAMGLYHDDFSVSIGLLEPSTTLPAVLGLAALAGSAIASARRAPVLSFAIGWFLIGHAVESTIIPLELVHEHRNYLPMYGILFGGAYYFAYPYRRFSQLIRWRYGIIVLYALLLGAATLARANNWKDEWTLYTTSVMNHPKSARAHVQLGIILHDNGALKQAQDALQTAAQLAPERAEMALRWAQSHFVMSGDVPHEILTEVEKRMLNYPISYITFSVFEPFFIAARNNPALHQRLIKIYEDAFNRPDLLLRPKERTAVARLLGAAYYYRGEYRKGITYITEAHDREPIPADYLLLADMHSKQGDIGRARELLEIIEHRQLTFTDDEARLLNELTTRLGIKMRNAGKVD